MNDLEMMARGWGDKAWWVVESVFFHSPNKGFWACLGDLPPGMPRRPGAQVFSFETRLRYPWVL